MEGVNWIFDYIESIKKGEFNSLDILKEKDPERRSILNNLRMISANYIRSINQTNPFFEEFSNPILLCNNNGVIIKANVAFYNIFNVQPEEVQLQFLPYLLNEHKDFVFDEEIINPNLNFDSTPLYTKLDKRGLQTSYWTSIACRDFPFYLLIGQSKNIKLSINEKNEYLNHFFNSCFITSLDQDNTIIHVSNLHTNNLDFNSYHRVGLNMADKKEVAFFDINFVNFMNSANHNKYFNGIIKLKFENHGNIWLDRTLLIDRTSKTKATKYLIDFDVSHRMVMIDENNAESNTFKDNIHGLRKTLDEFAIVAITDQKGTIKYVNDKFCEISKYSYDELIGSNHRILKSDEHSLAFFKQMYATISSGKVWRSEIKNIAKDGSIYWVDTVIVPFMNEKGKPFEYVSIRTDITEKKKIQKQLEEKLEAERKASMARQLMFSKLSHELRTPLNAVIGYTDLMLEKEQDPNQHEYLTIVKDAGQSLIALINEILDFTQLESQKIKLERTAFNLDQLIKTTASILKNEAERKNINIHIKRSNSSNLFIKADPQRIRQILLNLLSNAIKFTDKGSVNINYSVKKETQHQYHLLFEVVDTGKGISKENQKNIFEVFKQEHEGISRKYGGSGLGLSIVKALVEKYNGSICLESTLGEGSSFHFDLWVDKSSKSEVIKDDKVDVSNYQKFTLDGLKVLVLEDNLINQRIIRNRLEQWNCEVDITDNGHFALELLKTKKHQIILMDLQMPNMSGYDVTSLIRSQKESWIKNIPIIAQTAESGTNLIQGIKKAGMNGYLPKPFNPQDLFNTLVKYTSIDKIPRKVNKAKKTKIENKHKTVQLDFFIKETDGDHEMICFSINNFIAMLDEYMKQMELGLKNNDWDLIHRISHKIKPSIQMFKLEEFYKLHHSIVEASRNKDNTQAIASWFENQKKQYPLILEELRLDQKTYCHE